MYKSGLLSVVALAGLASIASADIVTVDAKAAIFDAGRDTPTLDGLLAPGIAVPTGTAYVTVPEVTGLVRAHPALTWAGPDGNPDTLNDTDINSYAGISGIIHPNTLALLGVFLTDAPPENPAPDRLDFYDLTSNFTSLSPELGQAFFIGDGWTDGAVLQQFNVPAGATRLYLGLADAGWFTGDPGAYIDNEGSFDADVYFTAIPAPGSLALLGVGGFVTLRRRRR